jgi:hypothetical protein
MPHARPGVLHQTKVTVKRKTTTGTRSMFITTSMSSHLEAEAKRTQEALDDDEQLPVEKPNHETYLL